MLINYADSKLTQTYQLMSQSIIPRPIAWVITENEGVVNIAPFSYFMGLSSEPATMMVSIGHKLDGTPKDTLRNLRDTKKCTICMVEQNDLDLMHLSSKELDASISEAKHFSIPTTKLLEDFPPMIKETANAFFCEWYQEVDLKGSKTIPVIVQIKHQHIAERCIIDPDKMTLEFNPVARIGKSYVALGEALAPPKIH